MASRDTTQDPNGGAASTTAEQLLVMHCLKEDSVLGRAGFSVRAASAASADDPALLDWAMKLAPYELPFDMTSGSLLPSQAPRRLARVPAPAGRVALVSSSYLPEDTMGRAHSYVSHLLVARELGVLEAAAAWNATDWQTDDYPRGETKVLPSLDHLPRGNLVGDAALTAFLRADSAPADQSLARTVFPARVESDPEARRRWLRASLHAFLRTGEPNAQRAQVCVLAEPGVVALLVYAIARLLPRKLADSFRFSTYEPPQSLRDNTAVRIIGSFARNGMDRPEAEALRRRCYVLDTVRGEYKPDVQYEADGWPLEDLVRLAARSAPSTAEWQKDWAEIDAIRDLWDVDPLVKEGLPVSLTTLAEAVKLRPQDAALKAGTLALDGLRALGRTRLGSDLLRRKDYRAWAWELVRADWTRPGVVADFPDIVGEHRDELLEAARSQARSGTYDAWRGAWAALKTAIPGGESRALALGALLRAQGDSPGAAAFKTADRLALLREWAEVSPVGAVLPAELHWLLRTPDDTAFRELIRSPGLDARHAGLAACLALARPPGGETGANILNDLSDDRFRDFAVALERFPEREAILARLFPAGAPPAATSVARFLRVQPPLPNAWLETILTAARGDEPQWVDYWLEGTHLETLLGRLNPGAALTHGLWTGLIGRITPENLMRAKTAATLQKLASDRDRYPDHIPPDSRDRLDGWIVLNHQFRTPEASPGPGKAEELEAACKAVGETTEDLVVHYIRQRFEHESDDSRRKKGAQILGTALRGFYSSEDAACKVALNLAAGITDRKLALQCKFELFKAIVSTENWNRLFQTHAKELYGTGIEPRLDTIRLGKSGKPPKKKGSGAGSPWLSRETKQFATAFVSGMVFMALLTAGLWFSEGFSLLQTLFPPPKAKIAAIVAVAGKTQGVKPVPTAAGEPKENIAAETFEREKRHLQEQLTAKDIELAQTKKKLATALEVNEALRNPPKRPVEPPTPLEQDLTDQMLAEFERTIESTLPTQPADAAVTKNNSGQPAPATPVETVTSTQQPGPETGRPKGEPETKPKPGSGELALNSSTAGEPTPAARAEAVANSLRALNSILENPLRDKQVPAARDLALKIHHLSPDGRAPRIAITAKLLLSGLSSHDVPVLISETTPKVDRSKIEFGFLQTGNPAVSALATLKRGGERSVYTFDTHAEGSGFKWTKQFPPKPNNKYYQFLVFSPTGNFALSSPTNSQKLVRIDSEKFYDLYFNGNTKVKDVEKAIDIMADYMIRISNDGKSVAIPSYYSFHDTSIPSVEIRTIDPNGPRHNLTLDFKNFEKDFRDHGGTISGMSFNSSSKAFIVGLTDANYLFAFDLNGARSSAKKIPLTDRLQNWSLSFDGRYLASVTKQQISIEDLSLLFQEGKPQAPTVMHSRSMSLSAVAFNRKGNFLATGDEQGIVTICYRSAPDNLEEVLRLAHAGPIRKVGFSPDGRVMAVLVELGAQDACITIWVTENWEKIEGEIEKSPGSDTREPS